MRITMEKFFRNAEVNVMRARAQLRDMMEAKYDTPARLKELVTCATARSWLLYAIEAIDKAAELLKELEEDIDTL